MQSIITIQPNLLRISVPGETRCQTPHSKSINALNYSIVIVMSREFNSYFCPVWYIWSHVFCQLPTQCTENFFWSINIKRKMKFGKKLRPKIDEYLNSFSHFLLLFSLKAVLRNFKQKEFIPLSDKNCSCI